VTLEQESERLTELLTGKTLVRVFRHRAWEVGFEFADGTRFFADSIEKSPLEISVTGGEEARAGSRMIESGRDSHIAASRIEGNERMEAAIYEAVFDRFT